MASCTIVSCPVPGGFYSHPPLLEPSYFFLASFSLLILINLYTAICHKTLLYSIPLVIGFMFEVLGYTGRILLRSDVTSTTSFSLSMLGTIIGPTFMTSSVYTLLSYFTLLYGKPFALVAQPLYVAIFFIAFSGFTVIFQAIGIAFSVSENSRAGVSCEPLATMSLNIN
jgi:hypothetical protein